MPSHWGRRVVTLRDRYTGRRLETVYTVRWPVMASLRRGQGHMERARAEVSLRSILKVTVVLHLCTCISCMNYFACFKIRYYLVDIHVVGFCANVKQESRMLTEAQS